MENLRSRKLSVGTVALAAWAVMSSTVVHADNSSVPLHDPKLADVVLGSSVPSDLPKYRKSDVDLSRSNLSGSELSGGATSQISNGGRQSSGAVGNFTMRLGTPGRALHGGDGDRLPLSATLSPYLPENASLITARFSVGGTSSPGYPGTVILGGGKYEQQRGRFYASAHVQLDPSQEHAGLNAGAVLTPGERTAIRVVAGPRAIHLRNTEKMNTLSGGVGAVGGEVEVAGESILGDAFTMVYSLAGGVYHRGNGEAASTLVNQQRGGVSLRFYTSERKSKSNKYLEMGAAYERTDGLGRAMETSPTNDFTATINVGVATRAL